MAISIGQITITDVHDGASTQVEYSSSTSASTPPSAGWGVSVPPPQTGYYVWKRERTSYADGTYSDWESPIRITGDAGQKGDKGDTGDIGPEGPQGPMGNPGQLGLYADGTTLYLKGFAEDGTLTAENGNIYGDGQRLVVPAYSQNLTAEGQGYVVFDGSTVQFAKLVADGTSKRWIPYNGGDSIGEGFWVIGTFTKNGSSIYNLQIVFPEKSQQFERSHFMDILAFGDIQNINVWAQANGIDQVFQRIAVLEAFINKVFANKIEMSNNGAIYSRYSENGTPPADGSGYYLGSDGVLKIVRGNFDNINITGSGTFKGIIDSPPLKTTTQSEAGSPVVFNTKTHWAERDLDALLSAYSTNTIHSASGTLDGIAVTHLLRATGSISISYLSASYDYRYGIAYTAGEVPAVSRSYTAIGNGTLSVGLRSRHLEYSYSASDGYGYEHVYANESVRLYKNGSLVATHTNINSVSYYNVAVTKGDVILITADGGASVQYESRGSTRTGWAKPEPGYTLYIYVNQQFAGAGTWLLKNGVWTLFGAGYYHTNTLTVASKTPPKNYAKGTAFVGGVASFPVNELKTASGSVVYNGQSYQVIGVMKTSATSMTVFHENGSINFSLPNADPGTSGYYNASGAYAVIASVAGAEVMNINARETDTYSIGNIKRFFQIIGKNVICDTLTAANTDEYKHSQRDFASGTLVYTSIDYSQEAGAPWVLEIKGNSYGATKPFFAAIQGYIYSNTVINYGGWSIGSGFSNIIVTNLGGKLCFWWPRMQYWQGFAVLAYVAYDGRIVNRVTSIVNSADPGGTKRVSITLSTQ